MFTLLLKDRGFPVHTYLQHMMKVLNFSRSEAGKRLAQFAFEEKLRDSSSTPLNNTMSDWVRTLKTPQWAVISSMQILEGLGRVPKSNQEWAFWALSRVEKKVASDTNVPENWPVELAMKWLEKAERYSYWYNRRSEIKQCLSLCESPVLAAKMLYNILGEEEESCSYADLFFSMDNSKLGNEQVASSGRNNIALNMLQIEHVCLNDADAKRTDSNIKAQLSKLVSLNLVEYDALNIKANKVNLLEMLRLNQSAE